MTVARVMIPGREVTIQEEARRLGRCSTCDCVCKDGTCSKTGTLLTKVKDEDCANMKKEGNKNEK